MERVFIHDMQFGFLSDWGTTNAIFILRQLQKNPIWLRTGNCTLLLLTLERYSIEYPEKSFGGPCKKMALRNGLCSLYRLFTTTPEVKLESITPIVINLELKLEFNRVLYLTISYSSLCLKFYTGTPWELLYADDLVIIAEAEDELKMKLIKWKLILK